MLKMRKG